MIDNPRWPCFICLKADCVPYNHRNDLLTDKHALNMAREMFGDTTLGALRDRMLGRFVIAKLTGEDPGDAAPFDR